MLLGMDGAPLLLPPGGATLWNTRASEFVPAAVAEFMPVVQPGDGSDKMKVGLFRNVGGGYGGRLMMGSWRVMWE